MSGSHICVKRKGTEKEDNIGKTIRGCHVNTYVKGESFNEVLSTLPEAASSEGRHLKPRRPREGTGDKVETNRQR